MPELIEQKVRIGYDAYGRAVEMTRHKSYDGKTMWRIVSHAASQRDDGERMDGLTDDNIREMIRALQVVKL